MHPKHLPLLCCPDTRESLALLPTVTLDNGSVYAGALRSESGRTYPIVRGVPRFVRTQNYSASFGWEWSRWPRIQFDSENVNRPMAGHTTRMWERITGIDDGLETRSPFLDVELAEFVLGLPWEMRFAVAGPLKRMLRAACSDLWPASVRSRGKQGFGAPVRHWLEQPAVDAMWRRVTRPDSALLAVLPGLHSLITHHSSPSQSSLSPQRRWTFLCLGLWLERNSSCLYHLS